MSGFIVFVFSSSFFPGMSRILIFVIVIVWRSTERIIFHGIVSFRPFFISCGLSCCILSSDPFFTDFFPMNDFSSSSSASNFSLIPSSLFFWNIAPSSLIILFGGSLVPVLSSNPHVCFWERALWGNNCCVDSQSSSSWVILLECVHSFSDILSALYLPYGKGEGSITIYRSRLFPPFIGMPPVQGFFL